MFVSKESVPVFLESDPENIIYIKPRMDYGTQTKVRSTIIKSQRQAGSDTQNVVVDLDLAAGNLALLTNNIVRWVGPLFQGTLCTPENIASLDPDNLLIDKVLAEINERNVSRADSPNASSAVGLNGSRPATAPKKKAGPPQT